MSQGKRLLSRKVVASDISNNDKSHSHLTSCPVGDFEFQLEQTYRGKARHFSTSKMAQIAPSSEQPTSGKKRWKRLYRELRKVKSAKDLVIFLRHAFGCVQCSLVAAVLLAVLNIIPTAMIVIGALNLKECRVNPNIPVWLIVDGTVALASIPISLIFSLFSGKRPWLFIAIFGTLLSVFFVVWFIVGSVWVYSKFSFVSYDDPDVEDYCDKTTYLFAFIYLTVIYSLIGLKKQMSDLNRSASSRCS
ncbi:unnamed protein product [Cylicocyclus nassatus]|uniref:Uncharacterized protein n=1 Tax=Cylicocyclus nassatus TaxID=53992 RepID=A0AA36M5Z3_CYLNA|nr:unnamed protein product [Cylicocyclus nassatus]